MADPDRRRPLLDSYENAAVIVSGIRAEKLGAPTPCPKYDVAGLVDHIVEAGYRAAALGRGQTPPTGDESAHVELADAPSQLRRAAEEAATAWGGDDRLSSTVGMPWGEEYTGATLVDMYLAELAVHAWDLARATGQLDRLNPSLAGPALDGARAMLKREWRDMVEPGSPFGAEVTPLPGADDWERLAAFTGRDPRPSLGQIASIKPTYGRVPYTGHFPDALERWWHVGPMARSVRDLRLARRSQRRRPVSQD